MLNCQFEQLDVATLGDDFMMRSQGSIPFYQCIRRGGFSPGKIGGCIQRIRQPCVTAKARVIKTIRVSMKEIQQLLEFDSDLKVIYLVRDPRAVLHSRHKLGYQSSDLATEAKKLCSKMIQDFSYAKIFQEKYTSRIMTVYYEHLANQTDTAIHKIFNEFNLPNVEAATAWIKSVSQDTKRAATNPFSTRKQKQELEAKHWRHTMSPTDIETIDKACRDAYTVLDFNS